jgi:hypothetical protein
VGCCNLLVVGGKTVLFGFNGLFGGAEEETLALCVVPFLSIRFAFLELLSLSVCTAVTTSCRDRTGAVAERLRNGGRLFVLCATR